MPQLAMGLMILVNHIGDPLPSWGPEWPHRPCFLGHTGPATRKVQGVDADETAWVNEENMVEESEMVEVNLGGTMVTRRTMV